MDLVTARSSGDRCVGWPVVDKCDGRGVDCGLVRRRGEGGGGLCVPNVNALAAESRPCNGTPGDATV
jgi:hypothetical protein